MSSTQAKMVAALIVAWLGPVVAKSGIMSADQFGSFVDDTFTWLTGVLIPVAMLVWTWWKASHPQLVKTVQASPTEQVVTVSPAIKAAVPDAVLAPAKAPTVLVQTPGAWPAAPKR